MSIIGSNILAGAAGSGVSAYEIEQSLRFDGSSSFLKRTPSSNGSLSTWTYSTWVKRCGTDVIHGLLNASNAGPSASYPSGNIYFRADNSLYMQQRNAANTDSDWQLLSTSEYRDPSAWYHLVFVLDTGNATANDRQRYYVNGVRVTDFDSDYRPDDNADSAINSTKIHTIGGYRSQYAPSPNYTAGYFNGYMAETHFVDGTALNPDDFGEYDESGVWRPIEYTGSYGTQGWYLKFDPSATNGIGHDHSGNGNNFTATGFTTSGTGTDVMSDTPTTNWCTLNPLDSGEFGGGISLSEGNLRAVSTSSDRHVRSTFFLPTSGKWYWEMTATTVNTAGYLATGLYHATGSLTSSAIATAQGRWYAGDGYGNGSSWGATYDDGDIIGIAVDMDSGKIWAAKNNTWQASGDPAAGTNPMYSDLLTAYSPDGWSPVCANWQSGNTADFNFGQRDFEYTPPTGFKALNTSNLPAPDIADGSEYFNTILWAGDNANPRTLTGVGFQPDWVWLKDRTQSTNHRLVDAVRGAGNTLKSNLTSAETSSETAGTITAFTSDGFTVEGTSTVEGVNLSGDNYVAWNWLAGNGTSSNTDGSITSTVSANPTAGFSIVKSQLAGSAVSATYGHGLGVAPKFLIVKPLNTFQWDVYHEDLGNTAYLILNDTAAQTTGSSTVWNSTSPTSTVFSLGTAWPTYAGINQDFIAYCFAEVEGYSKFGSYTGNGSSDGPFIYTGFKPAFVLVKRSSSSGTAWIIIDNARDDYNPGNHELDAENSQAELTAYERFDLLSNGFKQRSTYGANNLSGATYVYAAFASSPFGGSGVSPATAR